MDYATIQFHIYIYSERYFEEFCIVAVPFNSIRNHFDKHFIFSVINLNFSNVFEHLQIGTPPDKMIESDNQHPYIVAYGISKKEIISFYIEAERHLIPVR